MICRSSFSSTSSSSRAPAASRGIHSSLASRQPKKWTRTPCFSHTPSTVASHHAPPERDACTASPQRHCARAALSVTAGTTSIQFVKGTDETSVPDVRLTRSKDGTNGTAFFVFTEPDVFEATELTGEITGMYLVDEEGELQTVDVNAKFLNGKPQGIEATYVMKTTADWNRFMRFMERYAEDNGLGISAKK